MPSYAAILGHQPRLSLAEISAILPDATVQRFVGNSIVVFNTQKPIDPEQFPHWGGTVALAERIGGDSLDDVPQLLLNAIESMKIKGKVTFSIRTQGVSKFAIKNLYRTCKDALKSAGKSSRYVGNERMPAATIILHQQGMLDGTGGVEMMIVADENLFWIGRTIAAQHPTTYTQRDMEKPVRDTRVGLLPPKLAQVMLNLGEWLLKDKDGSLPKGPVTVYDPFCGTGVIPMECILRKWPILGSDKSEKAVTGCEKNVEWMRKISMIKKTDSPSRIWKQDATKPFQFVRLKSGELKEHPQLIVTEGHLGPPLRERPPIKEAQKMRTEVEQLQVEFLENVAKELPGVPLAIMWPVWFLKTTTIRLEKPWKAIAELGYQAVLPPGIEPQEGHTSLIYRRSDQFVGREIVLLRPVKQS